MIPYSKVGGAAALLKFIDKTVMYCNKIRDKDMFVGMEF